MHVYVCEHSYLTARMLFHLVERQLAVAGAHPHALGVLAKRHHAEAADGREQLWQAWGGWMCA